MDTMGKHYIAEFWGVDENLLNDVNKIEDNMKEAVQKAGGTILNVFTHKFSPQGVSTVITISESHLSIHTFPEHNYCAVDIYTCGKTYPENAIKHLSDFFNPDKKNVLELQRGLPEGIKVNRI